MKYLLLDTWVQDCDNCDFEYELTDEQYQKVSAAFSAYVEREKVFEEAEENLGPDYDRDEVLQEAWEVFGEDVDLSDIDEDLYFSVATAVKESLKESLDEEDDISYLSWGFRVIGISEEEDEEE